MAAELLKNIAARVPVGVSLMGLDVGSKTIGIAICDADQRVATPLMTLKRTKFSRDILDLEKIIRDYEIGGYIIGLPLHMDGSEGPRCQSVRDFAYEFERQISSDLKLSGDLWIGLWDERLSTAFVEEIVDSCVEKRKTRVQAKASGLIDKLAALSILQGALAYIQAQRK